MTNNSHSSCTATWIARRLLGVLFLAFLITGLAADPVRAEVDARSLAMGGAHTATARGLAAATWNPANLAFSPGAGIRLFGLGVDIHNNSFSFARYNQVSGQTLSDADKERLLSDIPGKGLCFDASVTAAALGVHIGRFALTTGVIAAGRGVLDRNFFDLMLFGNQPGQTVTFDDTWGDGHAVGKLSLSWGQPIMSGSYGQVAVGVSASYLKGLFDLHVEEVRGIMSTERTEITGEAFVSAVTAEDGSGFGIDLGAAWRTPGGWEFGLALDNVLSHLSWQGRVERTEYRLTASQINILNDDLDSSVVDSDTTYAVTGHTTNLPPSLRLGAARTLGNWLLAADYAQGLAKQAGTSTTVRLNLGAEWQVLKWLRPRTGLSLGGSLGAGFACGLGLRLGPWQTDLALMHRGGLFGTNTRGAGLGFSTQFVF